jgi:Fe2+ or Zn2+ uptake regulation protein
MVPEKRMARLRSAGVTPTMQRLAILEYLEGTKSHPTADEVYAAVHKTCPTIARATVYNTLEALTKSGTILQLAVDPSAARYDADLGPHVHFRCRKCGKLYDVDVRQNRCLGREVDGHQVESIRTYAFGVCASCRKNEPAETTLEKDPEGCSQTAPAGERRVRNQKIAAAGEPKLHEPQKASASDPRRVRRGGSPRA